MKKIELKWNVYRYDINSDQIYIFNIFDHGRFRQDVEKDLKSTSSKEQFSASLQSNLSYYYRHKAEHEIIISSWPSYITKEEYDRVGRAFEQDFAKSKSQWISPKGCIKIDIYDQIMLNYDYFLEYLWSCKKNRKEK